MRLYEEIRPILRDKYDSVTAIMLREILTKFHPDVMTEQEKLILTSEISKIILAYIFYHKDTEVNSQLKVTKNLLKIYICYEDNIKFIIYIVLLKTYINGYSGSYK